MNESLEARVRACLRGHCTMTPGGDDSLPLLSAVKAFAASRLYQFVPTRAYFIDTSLGLGHRDELPLTSPVVAAEKVMEVSPR